MSARDYQAFTPGRRGPGESSDRLWRAASEQSGDSAEEPPASPTSVDAGNVFEPRGEARAEDQPGSGSDRPSGHASQSGAGDAVSGGPDGSPLGESGEADVNGIDRPDDEMDAFFPSVARAAATGQGIASILDEELLVKALAERDEYLDALRRLQADFDNFRKRTERQLADVRLRASESLLERLLPVLDTLDLAVAHLGSGRNGAPRPGEQPAPTPAAARAASVTGEASSGTASSGAAGSGDDGAAEREAFAALTQVGGLLRDTLVKEGLERIDAVGVAFDPTVHDAVARASSPAGAGEEGVVVDEVIRAGYLLKGRVLRPAMVRVRG